MATIRRILEINGAQKSFLCDPVNDTLADVLRRIGLTGTKVGCGKGQCGACNVILNGKLIRSCVKKMNTIEDFSTVLTIEGLGTAENLHPLQLAWIIYGGVQCGFCTPGFIVSAKALLDQNPDPTREEVRDWFLKNRNACRCTGYKPLVDAVMAAARVMRGEMSREELFYKAPADGQVFGTAAPRPTAKAKVMGMADYGADVAVKSPDMLYLAMAVPDVAHANILNIDYSEAEKAPGVVKVITVKDVPGNNFVTGFRGAAWAVGTNIGMDHPVICDKKIFRRGDPVAVIAATSERAARAAAALVHVDYEELPEYNDSLESLSKDAVPIHPGTPNAVLRRPMLKGDDTRPLFEKAAYTAEFSVDFGKQAHLPIEPDCGNAYVDDDGILTIMYKSHYVYGARRAISSVVDMPPEKIRVIMNPTGGAFGYSLEQFTPALLAVCTLACGGRPVSLIMNYKEHSQYTGKRPGGFTNSRLACDENGRIIAAEADMVVDDGAYTDNLRNIDNNLRFFMNFYNVPHARLLGTIMLTNSQPNSAYRAPGTMEININYEQLVDMMAAKIGMDPFEFRYKNIWREDDCEPLWTDKPDVYVIESMMDTARPIYEKLKKMAEERTTDEIRHGVGISMGGYNVSHYVEHAESAVEILPDNYFKIYNTWEDLGQGADISTLAHAHELLKPLGVPADHIILEMNDTLRCPDTGPAAGSRSNLVSQNSLAAAVDQLLTAMIKVDGTYRSYEEMTEEDIPTKYVGSYDLPPSYTADDLRNQGKGSPYQSYCCFVSEVAVNTKTGKVTVEEMHVVTDVGKITNLLALEGQAYSGMMHGIGFALCEESRDPGKSINLMSSGFPYIDMIPDGDSFTMTNVGTVREHSSLGGSGCSEGFQSGGTSCTLNAIYNAVGIRIGSLPATPEKVKKAIEEKAAGTYEPQKAYDFGYDFYDELDRLMKNPPEKFYNTETPSGH